MKKAALIELGGSHDECLYSQVLFLNDANYQITLICSEKLKKQVQNFPGLTKIIYVDTSSKGVINRWVTLIKLRSFIIQEGFQKVIFNSAHGNKVRNFMLLPFPSSIKFIGTAHHTDKLDNNFSQKLISKRIKNYFVLNDYLIPAKNVVKNGLKINSFYPIFFPPVQTIKLNKKPSDIWVCIPGQVEIKRRDYLSRLQAIDKKTLNPSIKFILLGPSNHKSGDGQQIKKIIEEKELGAHFLAFDNFVTNETFHSYLLESDYILPLVHPDAPGGEGYLNYRISGSFNLAFAYKKPLLCIREFENYADFKENALFYSKETLSECINNLSKSDNQNKKLYQHPKWTFHYQKENYIHFIER